MKQGGVTRTKHSRPRSYSRQSRAAGAVRPLRSTDWRPAGVFNDASGDILSVFVGLNSPQRCRVRRVSWSVVDGLVLFLDIVVFVGLAAVFLVFALFEVLVVFVFSSFYMVKKDIA